jgi:hypothetical protein
MKRTRTGRERLRPNRGFPADLENAWTQTNDPNGLSRTAPAGTARWAKSASAQATSFHMELKWQKVRKIRRRIDLDFHDRLHKL